jgi:hemerythrin-like domain-containing protein
MKPRGQLMIEHRLIEKMLNIVKSEVNTIQKKRSVDPVLIDTIVDFIKTYADRTHHGKEEDILFEELKSKNLSSDDKKMMQDLVDEHVLARGIVKELINANICYSQGNAESLDVIIEKLIFLTDFYPVHILKEDKIFFPETEQYFSELELEVLMMQFTDFDSKMIHEKYNLLYSFLSNRDH